MKKIRVAVFSVTAILSLAACNFTPGGQGEKSNPISLPKGDSRIALVDPSNTSMVSENVKNYVDAMREQQETLGIDPYVYTALEGNDFVSVENYLDKGDVNGVNRSTGSIPDRSDKNMGIDLAFSVSEDLTQEKYQIYLGRKADLSDAKEYETDQLSLNVNNLLVNTDYYWRVKAGNTESDVHTFKTGDYPRWISARPLFNVRDNGGYMTSSGKRVRQGLVFRGGEITTMNGGGHYNTISESSKEVFRNVMKIGVELDLRGPSDIGDGYKANAFAENGDIEYKQYAIKSYEQTFTQTRSMIAPIFEILKEADQKPVYYHCFGGADRTGTLGFLLNGVLGVSYTDLIIDFELTSYSSIDNEHIRNHMSGHQHQYDRWPALINQIKTDTTGGYKYDENASLKDNIESFLVKACSVPQETINTIRDIMLVD